MKLEDMKDIVAPPGSVLILQPRAEVGREEYEMMCQVVSHAREAIGLPVLVIPHGMDAYVLQLPPEEDVTDVTPLVDISPQEDQHDLWAMYREGVIVQWREGGDAQWIDAHLNLSPIPQHYGMQDIVLRRKPK